MRKIIDLFRKIMPLEINTARKSPREKLTARDFLYEIFTRKKTTYEFMSLRFVTVWEKDKTKKLIMVFLCHFAQNEIFCSTSQTLFGYFRINLIVGKVAQKICPTYGLDAVQGG